MLVSFNVSLTYKNARGFEVTLKPGTDYFLTHCEETVKNEIYSAKQNDAHGETVSSTSLAPRYLSIGGFFNTAGDRHSMKRVIERTFNPSLREAGTLMYYDAFSRTKRYIDCHPEKAPEITFEGRQTVFEIGLIASNPFWRSDGVTEHLAMLSKETRFPVVIPGSGCIFGRRRQSLQSTFENTGDTDAGFSAKFTAAYGTARNPSVIDIPTGRFIRINYDMSKGDTIEIVSRPGTRQININGGVNNGWNLYDPDSEFFELSAGVNTVGYRADENIVNLEVEVIYTPNFVGV